MRNVILYHLSTSFLAVLSVSFCTHPPRTLSSPTLPVTFLQSSLSSPSSCPRLLVLLQPRPSSNVFIRNSVQSDHTLYCPEVPHLHCLNSASVSLLKSPSLAPIQQGWHNHSLALSLVASLSSFHSMTCLLNAPTYS